MILDVLLRGVRPIFGNSLICSDDNFTLLPLFYLISNIFRNLLQHDFRGDFHTTFLRDTLTIVDLHYIINEKCHDPVF